MASTRYALLVAPSANRVYAEGAPALVAAELATLAELAPGGDFDEIGPIEITGVAYVGFTSPELVMPAEALVANLSARATPSLPASGISCDRSSCVDWTVGLRTWSPFPATWARRTSS